MNVLVLTTMIPFLHGRAEELTNHLIRHMKLQGVNAEAMRLPFKGCPAERLLDEMFIFKSLKLFNVDRVISLGFPAYLVPFHTRVCWIMASHPQSYDYVEELDMLGKREPRARSIKDAVIRNDIRSFRSSKRLFASSKAVQSRMRRHYDVAPDILVPPLCDPERFTSLGDDGYILAAGRVDGKRRHSLLIDAMRLLPPSAKLIIAGRPDSPAEARRLQEQVRAAGLEGRVTLDLRALPRAELAGLVGRARAVVCATADGDLADGDELVMEALEASKPLITTADAGDLCNVVLNDRTGILSESTAEGLAESMAKLLGSSSEAAEMGAAGHEMWCSLKIDWSTTIERLLT
ncbi:glycosyltransferase family 4 protein [Microvirga aerophila]|uniref:Glycosyl transferase n=1 Tax=Microvirga aerophila TaxID=670291 RepID=A0A512BRJ5_9HYPH|nr:glycosyltransferase [Microvirga aerophila]GEO14623.1 glycosyl transferase [Microvirga aerophila]